MESDSFFYGVFKKLPQTLFDLIDEPAEQANSYRFESVEVKKSLRIDGLFLSKKSRRPVYFLEVQFQRVAHFYANLFPKVFCYLDDNDPKQEWVAVAIFPSRKEEPKHLKPYEDLLRSHRVKRVYLEDLRDKRDLSIGLSILQIVTASKAQSKQLVERVLAKARAEDVDGDSAKNVIELVEELLIRKFSEYDREEIRDMFKLTELRKTRAWQKVYEEGEEKGLEKGKILERIEVIRSGLENGMTDEQIAKLLKIPVAEVRRLAQEQSP